MRRAIVIAAVVLLGSPAGCAGEPADTADATKPADTRAAETTAAEEPETTTTRPRPTTPTTTSTTTTSTAPPTTTTTTTTTTAPPTTTTAPPPPQTDPPPVTEAIAAAGGCDPNYTGACVPIASDVDCAGGSGNGPAYVDGPVQIVGSDIYDLDGGGAPGVGCEG